MNTPLCWSPPFTEKCWLESFWVSPQCVTSDIPDRGAESISYPDSQSIRQPIRGGYTVEKCRPVLRDARAERSHLLGAEQLGSLAIKASFLTTAQLGEGFIDVSVWEEIDKNNRNVPGEQLSFVRLLTLTFLQRCWRMELYVSLRRPRLCGLQVLVSFKTHTSTSGSRQEPSWLTNAPNCYSDHHRIKLFWSSSAPDNGLVFLGFFFQNSLEFYTDFYRKMVFTDGFLLHLCSWDVISPLFYL